jgi:prepilin-type N-terminal cleavage/methylation domain-containing protein
MSVLVARRRTAGFTLIEVLVASALLGMSLVVMFGFHSQAVRSNMNAHRLTDCTYLAQTQMERLLSMDWQQGARPTDLNDGGVDASTLTMWANLEQPATPVIVNAANNTDPALGPTLYSVTWDVTDMDANETWVRLRVRCTYPDSAFNTFHGTTISSYRYRDS